MEPTITPDYSASSESVKTKVSVRSICDPLCHVTTLSKILAAVLFIVLPFLGAWVGYQLASENLVEVVIPQNINTQTESSAKQNENVVCDQNTIFPELTSLVVGSIYGDFTLSTTTFTKRANLTDSDGKIVCAGQLELGFTGTTTLSGAISVRNAEMGGTSDSNDQIVVDYVLDEQSKQFLPNGKDKSGIFSKDSIKIDGLRSHPYVIDAIKKCTPNVYCESLNNLEPLVVDVKVEGYTIFTSNPGGHGLLRQTKLVGY